MTCGTSTVIVVGIDVHVFDGADVMG